MSITQCSLPRRCSERLIGIYQRLTFPAFFLAGLNVFGLAWINKSTQRVSVLDVGTLFVIVLLPFALVLSAKHFLVQAKINRAPSLIITLLPLPLIAVVLAIFIRAAIQGWLTGSLD
jgi:hypothetical protein